MSERDERESQVQKSTAVGSPETETGDPCAHIKDPVRRGLCRVCQKPVIGEAPFCKDHEPPVP